MNKMRILILGGTRFIGPFVVRSLTNAGHEVTVFHKGETEAGLPEAVRHIHGDRQGLPKFKPEFAHLAPHVVLDMIAYTEQDAKIAMQTFKDIAQRVVAMSSQDVYRAYDRLRRASPGPPDLIPLTEDSPLRDNLYPYRSHAKGPDDWLHHYEKILVERAVMSDPDLPGTVLRLPLVYGPGDYQHRFFPFLKRMEDGRSTILFEEDQAEWRWTRGYVENVAAAIALAALDERAKGRTYNVGEAVAFTEAEWIRRIGRVIGWRGEVVTLPKGLLPKHLVMDFDWKQQLVSDSTRIREELGYAEPVALDEALKRTVEWERSNPPENIDPQQFDYPAEDAAINKK
jgi:nucleoside-diphosphate-sugar epimerase